MRHPNNQPRQFLVFQTSGLDCAFPLEDIREIVPMAKLSAPPGLPEGLAGFLDLRGTAVPIIRLDKMFDLPEQKPGLYTPMIILRGAPRTVKLEKQETDPGILVVDDSITSRSLEKSILEAHGYRVRTAVDGMEALEMLRIEKPGLIITDIQMPRLHGFGLVEALKADARWKDIPMIIISSLEQPEDRERGLLLGADAYVVKRKFDQTELLDAIRQLI